MKIALIATHLGPLPGTAGVEADAYPRDPARRVLSLARALAEREHDVTVYARQESAAAADRQCLWPGVAVEEIPAGPRRPLPADKLLRHVEAYGARLAERWRHSPPDVAHAHCSAGGAAALAAARGLGIPVAATFHVPGAGAPGDHRPPPGTGAHAQMRASVAHGAQAVLAETAMEGSRLRRLGLAAASVRIVPPGVDTARFHPSGPQAERGSRARLLVVGQPGDQRDLYTVLRVLADLPDAELVIAGGPERGRLARDPGYRALTRLARNLGVGSRLTCTGRVAEADMPPLMRSADVVVHITAGPRFAMVPAEAMACGTAVVVAADGAHADAVIHANTGFLVPPARPAMLARLTRQLVANPMLRDGYGIAAASRVRDRYSWERISQETLAVYQALQGSRNRDSAGALPLLGRITRQGRGEGPEPRPCARQGSNPGHQQAQEGRRGDDDIAAPQFAVIAR